MVYKLYGSVVIKQWLVYELCGGEQTYAQCVWIMNGKNIFEWGLAAFIFWIVFF